MPKYSIVQLKRAISIAEEINKLESELAGLVGGSSAAPKAPSAPVPKRRKRKVSATVRAKLAAAATARWAKIKGAFAAPATSPAIPRKKKRKLSPEGRARIVAALKARWAAKKKA